MLQLVLHKLPLVRLCSEPQREVSATLEKTQQTRAARAAWHYGCLKQETVRHFMNINIL